MAATGARVLAMGNRCFWITTSPQSATFLCCENTNTCEGHARYLASLASRHPMQCRLCRRNRRIRQHPCCPRAQRSCLLHRPLKPFAFGSCLGSDAEVIPRTIVPDSFLGGSAPRLQLLRLDGIPFPGLPKLLLSATHLVTLHRSNIPHFGYILPEMIITALSTLTSLETLGFGFRSHGSFPDRESPRPPPLTRFVLPVLTKLYLERLNGYLEDLMARIDIPKLSSSRVTLFGQTIFSVTPQFIQFISRTPNLEAFKEARLTFMNVAAGITLSSPTGSGYGLLKVKIICRLSNWQVISMGQVCTSCLPPLSLLEDLYILEDPRLPQNWQGNVLRTHWLELLHSFSAVRSLYLCEKFAPRIAPVLQELVGGRTTEVLPALRNIFLEGFQPSGPVQEGIAEFVAARQLSGHSITISLWERDGASLGLGTTTYS